MLLTLLSLCQCYKRVVTRKHLGSEWRIYVVLKRTSIILQNCWHMVVYETLPRDNDILLHWGHAWFMENHILQAQIQFYRCYQIRNYKEKFIMSGTGIRTTILLAMSSRWYKCSTRGNWTQILNGVWSVAPKLIQIQHQRTLNSDRSEVPWSCTMNCIV